MTPRIDIDEQTLQKLRQFGELTVEDPHGLPVVLMTVEARQELHKLVDDQELSEQEMRAAGRDQLDDPEGWGAPGMEIYDSLYRDDSTRCAMATDEAAVPESYQIFKGLIDEEVADLEAAILPRSESRP